MRGTARIASAPLGDPSPCAGCAVRNLSLCGALSAAEIGALNGISERRRVDAGALLVLEGDEPMAFANVVSGVAKLTRGLEDGREQIVGLLFPSDFLGRALGGGAPVPHSVQAATDLELCTFPASGFERVMAEHPALERKLLERTLTELDAARDWMLLLGRKTAPERVSTFLHHIARRAGQAGCDPRREGFDLPLTRADMADFIGLTIETVSRQITRLRRDGVIEMDAPRRVRRVDMERLAERAGLA